MHVYISHYIHVYIRTYFIQSGWSPVYVEDNLGVMSIGFMLPSKDDAIIWRGPRKNGLIKQFLTDVTWNELDYLIVDTPPGTSDEHISIVQYLKPTTIDGEILSHVNISLWNISNYA